MGCSNSACVYYATLPYFLYIYVCMYCMRFNCWVFCIVTFVLTQCLMYLFAYCKKLFQSSDWKQVGIKTLRCSIWCFWSINKVKWFKALFISFLKCTFHSDNSSGWIRSGHVAHLWVVTLSPNLTFFHRAFLGREASGSTRRKQSLRSQSLLTLKDEVTKTILEMDCVPLIHCFDLSFLSLFLPANNSNSAG